jgi:hypothetical protein
VQGFGGSERALGQDRMPDAIETEYLLPDYVDPVAGDDAERQVGDVAEDRRLACDYDVRKQRVLAVVVRARWKQARQVLAAQRRSDGAGHSTPSGSRTYKNELSALKRRGLSI